MINLLEIILEELMEIVISYKSSFFVTKMLFFYHRQLNMSILLMVYY